MFTGPNIITGGLVLYLDAANVKSYPGNGTMWFDLSKEKHNAVLQEPIHTNNLYFDFNGSSDYAYLDDLFYTTPNELSEMSVFAWIRTTYNSGTPGVWSNDNWSILDFDRSEVFTFALNAPGEIQMSGRPGSGGFSDSFFDLVGNRRFNDGGWHYIGWTFSVANQEIVMYGDGEVDRIFTADGSLVGLSDGTTRYGIIGDGSEASSPNSSKNNIYYNGDISIIHFYDSKTLTPEEIQQNYNATKSRYGL
jgi:hypothetical protein